MTLRQIIDRHFIKNPKLRKRVTRLIEGDIDKTVNLLGAEMTINSVREHGYLRASRIAAWSSVFGDEAPVLMSLASLLPHLDTIVDAGANVGLFSCSLGRFQRLFSRLRVMAFEADPETYHRLKSNLKGANQEAFNVAVSDASGSLKFIRGAVSHVTTTVDQANAYSLGDGFEIECRRLDSFEMTGNKILLKIDVEGQELKVLQGASRWFDERRLVCVYLDGFECRDQVFAFLRERDFEFRDGRTLEPAKDDTFSLLAMRKDWLAEVTGASA
jgi:FkbM family methyltransferase